MNTEYWRQMNEWMHEWMQLITEYWIQMNEWMHEWMQLNTEYKWMNEWMNEYNWILNKTEYWILNTE